MNHNDFYLQCVTFIIILLIVQIDSTWKESVYGKESFISCNTGSLIVVNEASFGYFPDGLSGVRNETFSGLSGPVCSIDASDHVAYICSGLRECAVETQYSVELSQLKLSSMCSFEKLDHHALSMIINYDCISSALFRQLSSKKLQDVDEVTGFLHSMDYVQSSEGGPDWRIHVADEYCRANTSRLPSQTRLLVPKLHRNTIQYSAHFIIRIKDMSFTTPSKDKANWRVLRGKNQCGGGPGQGCRRDFLSISSVPATGDGTDADLGSSSSQGQELVQFCLGQSSTPPSETDDSLLGEPLVGATFGPTSSATELQIVYNINLLEPNTVPGKGVLLEYIALFCTPIVSPTGGGEVYYYVRHLPNSDATVVEAEVVCPHDRYLEPVAPYSDDLASSREDPSEVWWMQRQRVTIRTCDHFSRLWAPNWWPRACITESELANFRQSTQERYSSNSSFLPIDEAVNKSVVDVDNQGKISNVPYNSSTLIAILVTLFVVLLLAALVLCIVLCRRRAQSMDYKPYHSAYAEPSSQWRKLLTCGQTNPGTLSKFNGLSSSRRTLPSTSFSSNLNAPCPNLPRHTLIRGSGLLGSSRSPDTALVPNWPNHLLPNQASTFLGSAPSLPDSRPMPAPPQSPWLRTSSVLGSLANRPSSDARLFDSSCDGLSNDPLSGQQQPGGPRWRRSVRQQRRHVARIKRPLMTTSNDGISAIGNNDSNKNNQSDAVSLRSQAQPYSIVDLTNVGLEGPSTNDIYDEHHPLSQNPYYAGCGSINEHVLPSRTNSSRTSLTSKLKHSFSSFLNQSSRTNLWPASLSPSARRRRSQLSSGEGTPIMGNSRFSLHQRQGPSDETSGSRRQLGNPPNVPLARRTDSDSLRFGRWTRPNAFPSDQLPSLRSSGVFGSQSVQSGATGITEETTLVDGLSLTSSNYRPGQGNNTGACDYWPPPLPMDSDPQWPPAGVNGTLRAAGSGLLVDNAQQLQRLDEGYLEPCEAAKKPINRHHDGPVATVVTTGKAIIGNPGGRPPLNHEVIRTDSPVSSLVLAAGNDSHDEDHVMANQSPPLSTALYDGCAKNGRLDERHTSGDTGDVDLLATQVAGSDATDSKARPLSDLMMSNHYYAETEPSVTEDYHAPTPPPALALPPLWSRSQNPSKDESVYEHVAQRAQDDDSGN